jgi:hypothetical protein
MSDLVGFFAEGSLINLTLETGLKSAVVVDEW